MLAMNYAKSVSGYQYLAGLSIDSAVDAALAFAVIYQIFASELQHYPAVHKMGGSTFRGITIVLVVAAVVLAWGVPGRASNSWFSMYTVLQRTARVLQCGQLVFLFLFLGYFRLCWRGRRFGVLLGLGILASVSLAVNAIQSQLTIGKEQSVTRGLLTLTNQTAYLIAVGIWIFYMLRKEAVVPPSHPELPEHDLGTWNAELERLIKP